MDTHLAFNVVLSGIGGLIVMICKGAARSLEKLSGSVDELNVKIAVVISQVDHHEKRIEKLETFKTNRGENNET